MKEGWTYKKLGEVCEILNGFAFKSSNYVPEGVRVIRITNVQKGYVEDNDPKYYPYETKDELSRYLLKEGDMLLSLTGNVGRVAILEKSYLPAYLNQRVACIRVRKEVELNLSFLFHLLYSQKFEDDCIKSSNGAAQLNMSTVWLASYLIPVPSLSEQQSIVDYLDSAFAKIDAMKANAEKALNEAKAFFQTSLKKMLEPKEGWEEKELKDICQIKGGKRLPKGCVLSSEPMSHRYITVADFTKNGTVVPSTVKYISDEVYKTIQRYTITSDDVYVTIVGSTVGKAGIIPPELDGSNLTENACKLVLNNDYDKKFVYYLMCSDYVVKQEHHLTKVSAQPKLALNRLASIIVYIPSHSEQQSIVTTLDSLKSKVDRLQENYDKISQECDALKQAILRQVFE